MKPAADYYYEEEGYRMIGSAHSVSYEAPEDDRAEQVRKIAQECSREPLQQKPPRKIGFY